MAIKMDADQRLLLEELYQATQGIYTYLLEIDSNLDNNDPEQIEELNRLIEARGVLISDIEQHLEEAPLTIDSSYQELIIQLQKWEISIQQRLGQLHQAFSEQIKRFQQSKKLTHRYQEGYGTIYTDGAFIDRRK